jgi:dinuclear metal center YbgI/SA1388 family protein
MASRDDILSYCDERLRPEQYRDVAINGLQVAGTPDIERLAIAVSTSIHTLTAADDWGADALLVHHGLLWSNRVEPLIGILAGRLRILFQNDINLVAYHLPLDGHDEIGNNVLLARHLGLTVVDRFAEAAGSPIGVIAQPGEDLQLGALAQTIRAELQYQPVIVGASDLDQPVSRVAIVTGSGYDCAAEAAEHGCQVLITGDIREPTMAEARELGVAVIAAGHEATERYGVQALGAELSERFGIRFRFFHDPNPV